ncbi:MAG: hypothetical protein QW794_07080 [Thermosphaera sp.]|uniref:Uncharacterized protein n=1 Tax=Ignisphaera aggregans TaxID=334771 RepID=A0A7J3I5F6_9CREN
MADGDSIKGWILRCTTCSTIWVLEVSFDIRNIKMLYHFCNRCRRNTFHEVLGRAEEAPMSKDE